MVTITWVNLLSVSEGLLNAGKHFVLFRQIAALQEFVLNILLLSIPIITLQNNVTELERLEYLIKWIYKIIDMKIYYEHEITRCIIITLVVFFITASASQRQRCHALPVPFLHVISLLVCFSFKEP